MYTYMSKQHHKISGPILCLIYYTVNIQAKKQTKANIGDQVYRQICDAMTNSVYRTKYSLEYLIKAHITGNNE